MRRRMIKLSHYAVKGIICLMWAAVAFQAVVYFVNPVRVDTYRLAVEYWRGMWTVLFS